MRDVYKRQDGSCADYYSVIRNSKYNGVPGIIVEHAYLSDAGDTHVFLSNDNMLVRMGQADASGIADYFGLHKKNGLCTDKYGDWHYYEDGEVSDYTGMALNEYGWWYVTDGEIDDSYTCLLYTSYKTATASAVVNGLKYAAKTDAATLRPWNTRMKSVIGGAIYIGSRYINRGQNTIYYEKFDMVTPYTHQYMTNVLAPRSESSTASQAYSDTTKKDVYKRQADTPSGDNGQNDNQNGSDNTNDTQKPSDDKTNSGDTGNDSYERVLKTGAYELTADSYDASAMMKTVSYTHLCTVCQKSFKG